MKPNDLPQSPSDAEQVPYAYPDPRGHFGPYGGSFVSETLTHVLEQLRDAYDRYRQDPDFLEEFHRELKHFVGRPSPIYHAKRWSDMLGGVSIRTRDFRTR